MAESLSDIFESTEPTLLTTGWGRAEGPLWHAEGYVTFVDLEGNRLLRWDPNGVSNRSAGEYRRGQRLHSGPPGPSHHVRRRRSPAHYPDGGRWHGHGHCRALARQTVQ